VTLRFRGRFAYVDWGVARRGGATPLPTSLRRLRQRVGLRLLRRQQRELRGLGLAVRAPLWGHPRRPSTAPAAPTSVIPQPGSRT